MRRVAYRYDGDLGKNLEERYALERMESARQETVAMRPAGYQSWSLDVGCIFQAWKHVYSYSRPERTLFPCITIGCSL